MRARAPAAPSRLWQRAGEGGEGGRCSLSGVWQKARLRAVWEELCLEWDEE